jgi:16S rRNA (cytidine1402-2'-O)-methyltransferase
MKLYIVATPIGNLEDVTYRAVRILKEVDCIICEDTRVTSKLLERYEIKKPLFSYHQRSKQNKTEQIIEKLKTGSDLALVTDAGTPGISDPGNELVSAVRQEMKIEIESGEMQIIPIPGASALITLASVAGINLQKFIFLGFPPNKKGRQTFFKEIVKNIKKSDYPVFYYDSPYRVVKNLQLLQEFVPDVRVIVGRELTKKFEEIKIGSVGEVLEYYDGEWQGKLKGEFVILLQSLKF